MAQVGFRRRAGTYLDFGTKPRRLRFFFNQFLSPHQVLEPSSLSTAAAMSSSSKPYTIIIFVTRKSDISPEQFKDHWENVHVPLLQSLAGPRFPLSHTRHYLARDSASPTYPLNMLVGKPENINFDGFAIISFASEEAFRDFVPIFSLPEVAEDEDLFTDRESLRAVVMGCRNETVGI